MLTKFLSLIPYSKQIPHGVSNISFLTPDHQYIIRTPKPNDHRDRTNEVLTIKLLQHQPFTLEYLYYDHQGYLVTKYLPQARTLKEKKEYLPHFAQLLRQFHQSGWSIPLTFHPQKEIAKYYQPNEDIAPFYQEIQPAINQDYPLTLCHNDLLLENILIDHHQIYLIDFEYSGMNYYLFDIASFISENPLTPTEITTFLEHYFPQLTPQLLQEINLWVKIASVLWYSWAQHYYQLTQEAIYQEIAHHKLQILQQGDFLHPHIFLKT